MKTSYILTDLGASCNLGIVGGQILPDNPELPYYIAHGYVQQVDTTEDATPKFETGAMASPSATVVTDLEEDEG